MKTMSGATSTILEEAEHRRDTRRYWAADYQVVCVCSGYGFPHGDGNSARIMTVGKALQKEGLGFRLYHCGPSPSPLDTKQAGVFEGLEFTYTTTTRRPRNRFLRATVYARASAALTLKLLRLRRERRRTAIWLYMVGDLYTVCVSWLCRLLGFPVVQELCEWWPDALGCSSLTRWLYTGPLFRPATGTLVISRSIEQLVEQVGRAANPNLLVHRLPSIVDTNRFLVSKSERRETGDKVEQFVWCGAVNGWVRDALFLVRAFSLVKLQAYRCRLVLIGRCDQRTRTAIQDHARQNGISPDDVLLTGYVDHQTLAQYLRGAAALLLPLWNNSKSRTRMPNKLPEYLASGRPVIAGGVGDLLECLVHGTNAYLAEPGDEAEFAECMIAVLRDPAAGDRIGRAGQQTGTTQYDYRAHSSSLAEFFIRCTHPAA
jgi:glycosyltransferase involved in cell wall biosynthesis